jgi:outer membrane receptor protein involved in Fe transport
MHINPLENLSFHLSYGYTYATFKDYKYSSAIDYSGNYLPMVPKNTFSAAVNFSLKPKNNEWVDKIIFNGQFTGAGRLYWKEDNIASQPFYGTLDSRISFEKKKISVDLWAKNITNTNYVTYYFTSQGGSYAQRGKPFTCGINFNIKLN